MNKIYIAIIVSDVTLLLLLVLLMIRLSQVNISNNDIDNTHERLQ